MFRFCVLIGRGKEDGGEENPESAEAGHASKQ